MIDAKMEIQLLNNGESARGHDRGFFGGKYVIRKDQGVFRIMLSPNYGLKNKKYVVKASKFLQTLNFVDLPVGRTYNVLSGLLMDYEHRM